MTSLDRAKRFMAAKATKLALTLLPLAALTVSLAPQARATTLTFFSGSCAVLTGTGTCNNQEASAVGGNSDANWIQVFGSVAPSQGGDVSIDENGSASGTLVQGDVIPVSWDFFVGGSGGTATATVGFAFSFQNNTQTQFSGIQVSPGSAAPFSLPITGIASGSDVKGSGSILVSGGGSFNHYDISLDVNSAYSQFSVSIPVGSTLDLNHAPSTPEPASLALAGSGLLAALFLKRRKKA